MPCIHLTTFIAAPADLVFDLSRSIDLHKRSMTDSKEEAVAGTTMGLIGLNETVTWKARHLLKTRFLKVKVTAMDRPFSFTDEQEKGDLRSMKHEHYCKAIDNGTILIDLFSFETRWGWVGRALNIFYLETYFRQLLERRNQFIKQYAESEKWRLVLNK
ncbi:MAG: SRPBCC family protein [Candidatus Pseudobacter hemicellulosilyticus]|uniref:SRPBCC family protein n=1 Tax=Candidatus Pseudobacter hemicellulosilyticus TaxID=3121375 RepID=A0AAJ5WVJ7_9BACT|nr:MAG: SRPBCC family protein [Pseudobacter sp.]